MAGLYIQLNFEHELLVIFAVMLLSGIIAAVIEIGIESRLYNKGICHICHQPLEFFDYDSRGGRGYKCPLCSAKVWVSYDCVDKYWKKLKNYKEDENNV